MKIKTAELIVKLWMSAKKSQPLLTDHQLTKLVCDEMKRRGHYWCDAFSIATAALMHRDLHAGKIGLQNRAANVSSKRDSAT
jgi:hypothetical protein